MPIDFSPGAAASVDIGGGVHGKVLRITADDESCAWNGFPVYMHACLLSCGGVPADTYLTKLKTLTLAPGASSTNADWPAIYVGNAADNILCGNKLQVRVIGTFTTPGIFGNYGVVNEATGVCQSGNEGSTGQNVNTGFVDCSASCAQMGTLTHDWLKLSPFLSNGSGGASWVFDNWSLETRWAANVAAATYCPHQDLFLTWEPPCFGNPGKLVIGLATDSCGVLTSTYTAVKNAINAAGLGLTASVLGGHGSDIATPDALCVADTLTVSCCQGSQDIEACEMAGADCSGALDWPYTG